MRQAHKCWYPWRALTSYIVIANAYMSLGFFGVPPSNLSGESQIRLPSKWLPESDRAVRLVMSALIRERPKSHNTAFPPLSTRMFNYNTSLIRRTRNLKLAWKWPTALRSPCAILRLCKYSRPKEMWCIYYLTVKVLSSHGMVYCNAQFATDHSLGGFEHNPVHSHSSDKA